jgi:tRNA 2-thiouridine synthesizing protein A
MARGLANGDRLEILATDPGAVSDFEAFCEVGGHELVEYENKDGVFRFLIRVSA